MYTVTYDYILVSTWLKAVVMYGCWAGTDDCLCLRCRQLDMLLMMMQIQPDMLAMLRGGQTALLRELERRKKLKELEVSCDFQLYLLTFFLDNRRWRRCCVFCRRNFRIFDAAAAAPAALAATGAGGGGSAAGLSACRCSVSFNRRNVARHTGSMAASLIGNSIDTLLAAVAVAAGDDLLR